MKLFRNLTGYSLALSAVRRSTNSRRKRLVDLMRHANASTPFYKDAFTAFLDNENDLTDEEFFYAYSHLPITEKQHLRDHNKAFKDESLEGKVDLLANGEAPSVAKFIKHAIWKKDFYTSISTGGTSGKPTFRWVDYDDANIFAQSFLHSFKLNGWKQGESFVVYYPMQSYFTDTYAAQEKALHKYFGFTMVPFETVTKESVEQLLKTLRSRKSTLLVIFPCVLQRVAEIMHEEDIPPFENLPYINVSGEFFMECSEKFIQTKFPDSDIQCTYGAVEFGEIAHQRGRSNYDYDVFDDYAFLEQGPRNSILVTAYRQHAFPLIRYKIEDMGRVINHEDGSQSIMSLEGKNTDYLIGADGYMYFASFFNEMVNDINNRFNDPIIHFMLRHEKRDGEKFMEANFVLKNETKQDKVENEALAVLRKTFANYDHISVKFPKSFDHDYTRKFKIIGEGDGLNEVVGGYHKLDQQRKAS